MYQKKAFVKACVLVLTVTSLIYGCGSDSGSGSGSDSSSENHVDGESRETRTVFQLPEASGENTTGNDSVSIDYSNISDGYFMVQYKGNASKVKLQLTVPDGETVYTYTITDHEFQTFPFSSGDGSYHLDVLENVKDNLYSLLFSTDFDVALTDELAPFLYPNQYSYFTEDNEAITYAVTLSEESSNDLDFVEQVYNYVIDNIVYDEEKAKDPPLDYVPDIDETMESGKGICFDYASLMTAMLRSQQVPTKLVVGYSGDAYHAWISVYIDEIGWVDNVIEFDGTDWSLMDPTLGANNSSDAVKEYVGDGSNYVVKYTY